jgi:glycerol kinase
MSAKSVNILGIETSCDETAAAVVADGKVIKSSIVASQTKLHEKYGGVVPEIASRAHIEKIYPVITEALARANVGKDDIDAIAVANQRVSRCFDSRRNRRQNSKLRLGKAANSDKSHPRSSAVGPS